MASESAMPSHWQSRPLEDVMEAVIDYRGKSPRKMPYGIPLVTAKIVKNGRILPPQEFIAVEDYDEWMIRGLPHAGDVLITTEAPLGEVAQLDERKVALAQRLIALRGKANVLDNTYLKYLLQSQPIQEELRARSTGTTVSGISQGELRKLMLPIPPIEEQMSVANVLGSLDQRIEANRKIAGMLETMARALFHSWFVEFSPFISTVEDEEFGLKKEVAEMFPSALADSKLGKIPRGWTAGTLNDCALLNSESWSRQSRPELIEYVDLANTKWGRIESTTPYSRDAAPSRAQRVLRKGDTIVGTVRPGNGSYALVSEDGLTGSTGFAVLRPRHSSYREFVYLAATATENIDELAHLADGGAYPAIRPEVVISKALALPPNDLLLKFSEIAGPWLDRMTSAERESRTLISIRDTLLPKLISGELIVGTLG